MDEKRRRVPAFFKMHRVADGGELTLGVREADFAQNLRGFFVLALHHQPARAAGNEEKQDQEGQRGQRLDS